MDFFIGKKRNLEHKILNDINKQNNINLNEEDIKEDNNSIKSDMNKLIDDCFDDFINGKTNNLIENYNLLKQKFYEAIEIKN